MSIVVTGSVAFDYLLTFPGYFREQILPDHLGKLSVSFLVDTKESFRGGCGPNIAYSLALLGNRPRLLATAVSILSACALLREETSSTRRMKRLSVPSTRTTFGRA